MDPDTLFKEDLTFEMFLEKVYKLKDFDKQVHFTLLQAKKPMRCEQVNKKMKTDTVKVYRSLQKLTKAGLVEKTKMSIARGGHYMIYEGVEYDDSRDVVLEKVEEWYKTTKRIIENR